jgi:hypothetical protein
MLLVRREQRPRADGELVDAEDALRVGGRDERAARAGEGTEAVRAAGDARDLRALDGATGAVDDAAGEDDARVEQEVADVALRGAQGELTVERRGRRG